MYKSDAIAYAIFGGLLCFILGGMDGSVVAQRDASNVARQAARTTSDARICWEALYALNKLRGNPDMCPAKQAEKP